MNADDRKTIRKLGEKVLHSMEAVNWGKPRNPPPPVDPTIGLPSDLYSPIERDIHRLLSSLPELLDALNADDATITNLRVELETLRAKYWKDLGAAEQRAERAERDGDVLARVNKEWLAKFEEQSARLAEYDRLEEKS